MIMSDEKEQSGTDLSFDEIEADLMTELGLPSYDELIAAEQAKMEADAAADKFNRRVDERSSEEQQRVVDEHHDKVSVLLNSVILQARRGKVK